VTATCPAGHASTTTDYCDICGAPMTVRADSAPDAQAAPEVLPPEELRCAACGEVREGRFCETCGYDSDLGNPAGGAATLGLPVAGGSADAPSPRELGAAAAAAEPTGGTWTAVVRADRDWFEEVRSRRGPDADTLQFPRYPTDRRFPLTGPQMLIGRRSRSRGIDPEIDLADVDPGVSVVHALLVARADGGWDLVDLDSTNGTVLDGDPRPIPPNTPVTLADGARIKLGAWTTITVHARESAD
jgi:hypothetical protein